MNVQPAQSVGLGGDGDEIAALRDVEEAFGVKLDYTDARNWHTAGDVYAALCKALPPGQRDKLGAWDRFTEALARQTGVQPSSIESGSPLLSQSRLWIYVANGSAVLWLGSIAVAAVIIGWSTL